METTAAAGVGEFGLHFAGDGGVEGGEDDFRCAGRICRRNGHARDPLWERGVESPFSGFAVELPAGAVTGGEPGDFEPRMVFEELNETLADHSGRAEDADWIFVLHDR